MSKCEWCKKETHDLLIPVIMPNLNEGVLDICFLCYQKVFLESVS